MVLELEGLPLCLRWLTSSFPLAPHVPPPSTVSAYPLISSSSHSHPLSPAPLTLPRLTNTRHQLLTKDPARRLGASEADASEIKAHLFFKDTNWDDVFHKRIPSPFYPAIVRLAAGLPSLASHGPRRELTLSTHPTVLGDRHEQL